MARGPVGRESKRGAAKNVTATERDYPPLPGAEFYSARTIAWYEVWATSPQASRFVATDWQRLHMLAPLVEMYFVTPERQTLAEIRLNEAKLGATPEDRERLRWNIEEPDEPDADEPKRKRSRERKDPRASG